MKDEADHPYEPCGAGRLTSDAACWAVREKGGRRDRCHAVDEDGRSVCQRSEFEHPQSTREAGDW